MAVQKWMVTGLSLAVAGLAFACCGVCADAGEGPTRPTEAPAALMSERPDALPPELMPIGAVTNPEPSELKSEVERLVGAHMQALEKQKKADEADKKKQEEAKGFEVGKNLGLTATWRNGLNLESVDKAFRVHIGGRLQAEWGFVHSDNNMEALAAPLGFAGDLQDSSIFRRGRLQVDGTMYEVVDWVTELDFSSAGNGDVSVLDLHMTITHLPYVGNLRIGHFKEPFSLEELTGDNFITFMERSLEDEAFVPARNSGFMLFNTLLGERMTWAAGFFRTESNGTFATDFGDGEYAYTGRVTCLPWYEHNGRCLLHLGAAASHRNQVNDDEAGSRGFFHAARPEMRSFGSLTGSSVFFANTSQLRIRADDEDLVGVEAAVVWGPFSVQSEGIYCRVNDAFGFTDRDGNTVAPGSTPAIAAGFTRRDLEFYGGYIQASYYLTGENRNYRRTAGAFDRPGVHEAFFLVATGEDGLNGCCYAKGAVEVVARYSMLDLQNAGVDFGTLRDVTLGLNWYLNPNARVYLNYIISERDAPLVAGDGQARLFGMRFQVDF